MLSSLFGRLGGRAGSAGWLAVELGAHTASFAHVVPNGARPVVEFVEERPWDPASPKSLAQAARDLGVKRFQCTTLLRPEDYQILLVEAPAVKPEELKSAVRWRIKDMIDYHVDDATIDVLDVPTPGSGGQRGRYMYTVAARNSAIRETIDRFATGGLPLSVIDIPDTAQRNLAAYFETDQRGVLALTFDAQGGLLTVTFGGELYLTRRVESSSAHLATGGELGLRLFERVLVETQRSLDHCERTYPFISMGRVLVSPFPGAGPLREYLAANLYLPVESLDLGRVASLPAAAAGWTDEDRVKWLKLIGAGLRVESKAL